MWCKLRLNQGQRWQILHLPTNLQRHVNWYANVVFTTPLISSSFTLFLHLICSEQICVNLIFPAVTRGRGTMLEILIYSDF